MEHPSNQRIAEDVLALYEELGWHVPAQRTLPRLLPLKLTNPLFQL